MPAGQHRHGKIIPFLFSSTQLEVSTTDFTGNLVEGPAILVITVIDQNDNRPIFKETRYTGEVLEGSPTGWCHSCVEDPMDLGYYWILLGSNITHCDTLDTSRSASW